MALHDLASKVLAHADRRALGEAPSPSDVPGLAVSRQRRPGALAPVLYQPIFCLVLQGAKQAMLGKEIVAFPRGHSIIVGIDLPTEARVTEASVQAPYVALALQLDMGLIRELSLGDGLRAQDGERVAAISADEADDAIIDAMGRLFALTEKPAALPVLHPLLMREIHYWLLGARHGAMLRAMAQADSHASKIAKAALIIRQSYQRALVIADLAGAVGMSVSAFHLHFRSITGTTPLQFQKRLRLFEARRLMQTELQTVSAAAFSVGYESSTQFSREYARMFGQPPLRHIRSGEAMATAG